MFIKRKLKLGYQKDDNVTAMYYKYLATRYSKDVVIAVKNKRIKKLEIESTGYLAIML